MMDDVVRICLIWNQHQGTSYRRKNNSRINRNRRICTMYFTPMEFFLLSFLLLLVQNQEKFNVILAWIQAKNSKKLGKWSVIGNSLVVVVLERKERAREWEESERVREWERGERKKEGKKKHICKRDFQLCSFIWLFCILFNTWYWVFCILV